MGEDKPAYWKSLRRAGRMRKAEGELGGFGNGGDGFRGVVGFGVRGPDRAGPGEIVGASPDDVDVHLTDDVADAGDVEFFGLEGFLDEVRDFANEECDFGEFLRRELVKVFDFLADFGDDEDPGEGGVFLESDLAAFGDAEEVGAGFEAGMKGKGHGC